MTRQPGAWSPTGSLATARAAHTATRLPTGQVLVAGGTTTSTEFPAGTEQYDPATGAWSAAGDLNVPRADATATLLQTNVVLLAGGRAVTVCTSAGCGDINFPRVAELYTQLSAGPTPTPVVPELPPPWLFGIGLLVLGGLAHASRRRR
jgi:hypothetical protein